MHGARCLGKKNICTNWYYRILLPRKHLPEVLLGVLPGSIFSACTSPTLVTGRKPIEQEHAFRGSLFSPSLTVAIINHVHHTTLKANKISEMAEGSDKNRMSFNFNKFRSMILRVKVGVQLDADMLLGPNCDKLFDATEREITAEYPYPIMPVHWMSRYKEQDRKIDGQVLV
jgi:hypothetical protein